MMGWHFGLLGAFVILIIGYSVGRKMPLGLPVVG